MQLKPVPRDHRHAAMLRDCILRKEREGYILYGTEVPYRRGYGHGYIDVLLSRGAPLAGGAGRSLALLCLFRLRPRLRLDIFHRPGERDTIREDFFDQLG